MPPSDDIRRLQRPSPSRLLLARIAACVMLVLGVLLLGSFAELKPAGIAHTLTPTLTKTAPGSLPLPDTLPSSTVPITSVMPPKTATPTPTATPTTQPASTTRSGLCRMLHRAYALLMGSVAFLPLALVIILLAASIILLLAAARILCRLKRGREWPVARFPPRRAVPSPRPRPSEVEKPEAPPPSLVTVERPEPGTPYLESLERLGEVVYCPLTQPVITIGRDSDNDLVIDEHFVGWRTVSRHHARVERDGESFVLVDMDSENGVYVNGRRTRENILHDGCHVSFGRVRFVFRLNRGGSTP